jgi:uncharacterized damage-inducible protein DinB
MNLTIDELLNYTDEERARWREWFAGKNDEPLKIKLESTTTPTVGALIIHMAWAEGFYAFWMQGDVIDENSPFAVENKDIPADQTAAIFGFAGKTRKAMRDFTDRASAEDWERIYETRGRGIELKGSARKLIAHILVHEIRHWAQVAISVREKGLVPPGDHDLCFSPSFGPLFRRL